jgi:BirA family biotin operon repressor/biotin-[acetyl-CoA-carboxylase] ligase
MLFRFAKLPQYHAPVLTETPLIGRVRIHLDEVNSTNNYARQLLHDSLPVEGTLITAAHQSAGRGQRQHTWESAPSDNITCSYILRPVFLAADRQFALSAAVALAVYDAVAAVCPSSADALRIKWPNDILIGTKKVAGILIENAVRGRNLDTSVVGIGLNVNQQAFSDGLRATSLALAAGEILVLSEVQAALSLALDCRYSELRSLDYSSIMEEYNRLLYRRNTWLQFSINGVDTEAKLLGAQHSGLLNLLHADGSVTEHQHHELRLDLGTDEG